MTVPRVGTPAPFPRPNEESANPWREITSWAPHEPLVAPADRHALRRFERRLALQLFPEPFVGNLDACAVVLLAANPGLKSGDEFIHLHCSRFRTASRANLEESDPSRRFFLLEPAFQEAPGHHWWRGLLSNLHAEYRRRHGTSDEEAWSELAVLLCSAELQPYHSTLASPARALRALPSSQHTYRRVREASARGALLIDIWEARWKHQAWVEELGAGERIIGVPRVGRDSSQHASVDRAHLGSGYQELVDALDRGRRNLERRRRERAS